MKQRTNPMPYLGMLLLLLLTHNAYASGLVTGTALYRERLALPPDAVFEAVLLDVSRADAPATVLGRARLEPAGNPPFRFEIAYDETAVQPGHRYAVRATVTQGGRLWFTTNRHTPALDGRNVPLKLLLVRAGAPTRSASRAGPTAPPARVEPRQTLSGLFSSMADAASITLCADGRRLPVAMEGDFKALAAAYRQAAPQPGQPVLVTVEGCVATRPSMEESHPPLATLVVERFIEAKPNQACPQPTSSTALRDTYWKLVQLGETPIRTAEKQREPHLVFASAQPRVSGSGGCNRITGGYETDGDQLRLRQMAGTMMACLEGMEHEQRFLKTLEQVRRYRITGQRLDVLDENGQVLAQFEAVALR